MGIVVGFAVRYLLGTRAGRERFNELVDACRTIAGSRELQSLMLVGTSLLTVPSSTARWRRAPRTGTASPARSATRCGAR